MLISRIKLGFPLGFVQICEALFLSLRSIIIDESELIVGSAIYVILATVNFYGDVAVFDFQEPFQGGRGFGFHGGICP